jgi:hypothetical protein
MSETNPMTTAQALASFHRELVAADIPHEVVRDLMEQAGRALLYGDGNLVVKQDVNV